MNKTTIKIVIMAAIIILMSFIPEMFPHFFGDWKCDGINEYWSDSKKIIISGHCQYLDLNNHNPSWHWGFRHWVWFSTGLTLLIINIVNMVDKDSDK